MEHLSLKAEMNIKRAAGSHDGSKPQICLFIGHTLIIPVHSPDSRLPVFLSEPVQGTMTHLTVLQ